MIEEFIELFKEILMCFNPFREKTIPLDLPSKEFPFHNIGWTYLDVAFLVNHFIKISIEVFSVKD